MNLDGIEKIADTVLYEGYMLYPYRPSATKNRQRWCFGILYPPAYCEVGAKTERAAMHTECLIEVEHDATLKVNLTARFLHLRARRLDQAINGRLEPVQSLTIGDRTNEAWEEGVERTAECEWCPEQAVEHCFSFPATSETEQLTNAAGQIVGTMTHMQAAIAGRIAIGSEPIAPGVVKLIVDIANTTPAAAEIDRDSALLSSLISAHFILRIEGGQFVSLLDPPSQLQAAASRCRNEGNFPVLAGDAPQRNLLLCSPIVLYDYPQIAPESAGDFFDGTEIDEMLTLRVMTLTDAEKNEMRSCDPRASELLRRTEQSAREQLMRTHGRLAPSRPRMNDHDAE